MSNAHFQKFNKKKNSVIKEGFKQAKKKAKKENISVDSMLAIDARWSVDENKRRMKEKGRN